MLYILVDDDTHSAEVFYVLNCALLFQQLRGGHILSVELPKATVELP